ncbi:E4 ORF4 [Squirrel monkey adenovirus]|nr:E4 ORF4 [Squirrel monkey adenovirus]
MFPLLPAIPAPPLAGDRRAARDWIRGTRALVDDLIVWLARVNWDLSDAQWRLLTGLSQLLSHANFFESSRRKSKQRSEASWRRAFFCFQKYNWVREQLEEGTSPFGSVVASSSSVSHVGAPQSPPSPGSPGSFQPGPAAPAGPRTAHRWF